MNELRHFLGHGTIPPLVFLFYFIADFGWKIAKDSDVGELKRKSSL